jgi:hypothetical protein
MSRIFFAILILCSAVTSMAGRSNWKVDDQAPMCVPSASNPSIQGGDLVPWPWGNEVKFPWARIQGVWAPLSNDCNSNFVFKVGKLTDAGDRFIQITQYDPRTCQKLASGAGYENDRVIYASMTNGTASFYLTIRAFDTSVLKDELMCQRNQVAEPVIGLGDGNPPAGTAVIVLTLYQKQDWDKRSSYQLTKLQATPTLLCQ